MNNKQVSVWRGTDTPPTIYHVWIKPDNSIWLNLDGEWKIVSLTINQNDNILTNNQGNVYSTLNLVEETSGLESNVLKRYKLIGKDNIQIGQNIDIYKDKSLKSVQLVEQNLIFTYILEDGSESVISLDVSKFLIENEIGQGLDSSNGIIFVKKDPTSEDFISISNNGIKIHGILDLKQELLDTFTEEMECLSINQAELRQEYYNQMKDYVDGFVLDLVTNDEVMRML